MAGQHEVQKVFSLLNSPQSFLAPSSERFYKRSKCAGRTTDKRDAQRWQRIKSDLCLIWGFADLSNLGLPLGQLGEKTGPFEAAAWVCVSWLERANTDRKRLCGWPVNRRKDVPSSPLVYSKIPSAEPLGLLPRRLKCSFASATQTWFFSLIKNSVLELLQGTVVFCSFL